MKRKWRAWIWEFPLPREMHVPAAQIQMRDWLAGMSPREMYLWQQSGGWIPPELIEVFQEATSERRYAPYAPPVVLRFVIPKSWTAGTTLITAGAAGGSVNAA